MKHLNLSEDAFWNMIPTTFFALMNSHNKANNIDSTNTSHKPTQNKEVIETTIDKMPSWW